MTRPDDPSDPRIGGRALLPIQSLDFDQVQVQIQVAPLTPENITAFFQAEDARIKDLLSKRDSEVPRRAVVIVDGSNQLVPPAAVRRIQAEWMRQNAHMLRTVIHTMGVVIPSAVARGAFTAVMWLASDRVSWEMVAQPDLPTAIRWAIREVQSIGGTVSPELLRDGAAAVERKRAELMRRSIAADVPRRAS